MLGLDQDYAPVELGSDASSAGGDATSSTGGIVTGGGGSTGTVVIAAGGRQAMIDAGSGGHSAAGGSAAAGEPPVPMEAGACTADSCGAGEKCCPIPMLGLECVQEQPLTGCGASSCDSCPAPPANGVAVCTNGACAVLCNEAYELSDSKCVPMSTGGAGGASTGGTTGAGGKATGGMPACTATDTSRCPPCNIAGPAVCCQHNQTCGCSWAPGFACY